MYLVHFLKYIPQINYIYLSKIQLHIPETTKWIPLNLFWGIQFSAKGQLLSTKGLNYTGLKALIVWCLTIVTKRKEEKNKAQNCALNSGSDVASIPVFQSMKSSSSLIFVVTLFELGLVNYPCDSMAHSMLGVILLPQCNSRKSWEGLSSSLLFACSSGKLDKSTSPLCCNSLTI